MARKLMRTLLALLVVCSVGSICPAPSPAALSPGSGAPLLRGFGLGGGDCNPEEAHAELARVQARIAAAGTLEDAKGIALDQTGMARKALSRAKWVIPFNGAIGDASRKIDAYEVRVQSARSPEEVAAAFGGLVRLASADGVTIVDAKVKADCHYTTGEIVIIVIGFLLAIIPGLIFLAILC